MESLSLQYSFFTVVAEDPHAFEVVEFHDCVVVGILWSSPGELRLLPVGGAWGVGGSFVLEEGLCKGKGKQVVSTCILIVSSLLDKLKESF